MFVKYLGHKGKYMYLKKQVVKSKEITDLWKEVINYGYQVRCQGLNGEKAWSEYKEKIKDSNDYFLTEKIFELIKKVNFSYTDDHKEQQNSSILIYDEIYLNEFAGKINEVNHFILQHFRIPNMAENKKISTVKLLQLAYNIGQAKCEFEKKTYSDRLAKFYQENKLDEITTYIL